MKELSDKELREVQLGILEYVDNICRANGIDYFLCGGTLIGAVRHGGYIPWDDDIDIMLKRRDCERLREAIQRDGNPQFEFLSHKTDRLFPLPYAKVCDNRTLLKEDVLTARDMGVNIDVFPIDEVSDDPKEQRRIIMRNRLLINALQLKGLYPQRRRSLMKNAVIVGSHLLLCLTSVSWLVRKINQNAQRWRNDSQEHHHCGVLVWGYGEKEILKKDVIASTIDMDFETIKAMVPAGYDTYLRSLYGDYMQLPPESQRITHHAFKAYWTKD